MDKPPILRDVDLTNGQSTVTDLAFSERRYEYLIAKRDQAQDRIRTGLLALNGASLVAMLALLGNDSKSASWIGVTADNARLSACAFAAGLLFAGISMIITGNLFVNEAGAAFARYMAARRVHAAYHAEANEQGWERITDALEQRAASPLVDFEYSVWAIAAHNISAACCFVGICVPIGHSFGW